MHYALCVVTVLECALYIFGQPPVYHAVGKMIQLPCKFIAANIKWNGLEDVSYIHGIPPFAVFVTIYGIVQEYLHFMLVNNQFPIVPENFESVCGFTVARVTPVYIESTRNAIIVNECT